MPIDEAFRREPFLGRARHAQRWTVSDRDKMPLDAYAWLVEGDPHHGCKPDVPHSMVDLDALYEGHARLGVYPPNASLLLDCERDGFVVLDVEPSCPDDVRTILGDLPHRYAERSQSGEGLHLVFDLPSNYHDHPDAAARKCLRHEQGWYELHLCHWLTFTGDRVELPGWADPCEVDALFARLAEANSRKIGTAVDFDCTEMDLTAIPKAAHLVGLLTKPDVNAYRKTLDDFAGDASRYEFGFLGYKYCKLCQLMRTSEVRDAHLYDLNERTALLHEVARRELPWRDKHDETRNGLPWLLSQAKKIVAENTDPQDLPEDRGGG